VLAGTFGAAHLWIKLLAEQGQINLAERIRREGLTPDWRG